MVDIWKLLGVVWCVHYSMAHYYYCVLAAIGLLSQCVTASTIGTASTNGYGTPTIPSKFRYYYIKFAHASV